MRTMKTTLIANDWRRILDALEIKTKEIQDRSRSTGGEESEAFSEAARWAVHVRRIVDEIARFTKGD